MRRSLLVAVALVALIASSVASADGDPASDTLIIRNVFVPYPTPTKDVSGALTRQVDSVYASRYRLKVAVVASQLDLGAIPSLFNKPTEYGKFLGQELSFAYIGPLLIVMPAGFAIYDGGRSVAAEARVLAKLKVTGTSPDDLTRSATAAVTKLQQANALTSKDVLAPRTYIYDASGRPGQPVKLRYAVFDDSGWSATKLTIGPAQGKPLKTFRVPMRQVQPTAVYSVKWTMPLAVFADLRVCLTATDPAGNKAKPTCSKLTVG
jgi:hypothetical protein